MPRRCISIIYSPVGMYIRLPFVAIAILFCWLLFFFFQPPLWSTVMEIRCTLVDRRCMHTRFRSGESEFRFELYTLTFSTMRNFLCFFRCRKYLIVACLDWWMVVRFWFIPLTLSGGKNDGNRRCFEHSLPCLS